MTERPHRPRDPQATSRLMASVRHGDTEAEVALRRALWRLGLRYRLHDRRLPGTPDIVLRGARVAVFVDGDYWHGRILLEQGLDALRAAFRTPNRDFWIAKIVRNVERDRRQTAALECLGWRVIRVWSRDVLRSADQEAARIRRALASRAKPARS